MNACIRAVVRSAMSSGHEVLGIRHGYHGLLNESFFVNDQGEPRLSLRSVSGISRFGGTILGSARSEEFRTDAGVRKAADILRRQDVGVLIPIGGDGTLRGAVELSKYWNGRIVACPGTIDNDLIGSDYTIGFSTAVHTAVEAIDKIRDTAESHDRMFLIEVMGRHSGYIAVYSALAGAAEIACVPESVTDIDAIVAHVHELKERGKRSILMVIAEGDEVGGAPQVAEQLQRAGCPYSIRYVILGHLLRGGSPSPEDRLLASRLGEFAVRSALQGATGVMAGYIGSRLRLTPFEDTFGVHKPIPRDLFDLMQVLAH